MEKLYPIIISICGREDVARKQAMAIIDSANEEEMSENEE